MQQLYVCAHVCASVCVCVCVRWSTCACAYALVMACCTERQATKASSAYVVFSSHNVSIRILQVLHHIPFLLARSILSFKMATYVCFNPAVLGYIHQRHQRVDSTCTSITPPPLHLIISLALYFSAQNCKKGSLRLNVFGACSTHAM